MLRNNRNALWALGLAGAAYLWRNRAKLQQKASEWQSNRAPRQLPDYGTDRQQEQPNSNWGQPSQGRFSGTEV
jgi:hypothetical protein